MKLVIKDELSPGIKAFVKKQDDILEDSQIQGALQIINWIANGSPYNSRVPPIKSGILRGSGSVFVGDKFITATPDKSGKGTPVTSYSGKKNVATIIYNTAYASRLHEETWKPGKGSVQSGDVGNKWIESHLESDGKAWLNFIAKLMSKAL